MYNPSMFTPPLSRFLRPRSSTKTSKIGGLFAITIGYTSKITGHHVQKRRVHWNPQTPSLSSWTIHTREVLENDDIPVLTNTGQQKNTVYRKYVNILIHRYAGIYNPSMFTPPLPGFLRPQNRCKTSKIGGLIAFDIECTSKIIGHHVNENLDEHTFKKTTFFDKTTGNLRKHTGGGQGVTWGMVPPKFEVGDGPCIRFPNILKTTRFGCEAKHELSKKGFAGGL